MKTLIMVILTSSLLIGCENKPSISIDDNNEFECYWNDPVCLPLNTSEIQFSFGQYIYVVDENGEIAYYRDEYYDCIEDYLYDRKDYSSPLYIENNILKCNEKEYLDDEEIWSAILNGILR